MGILVCYNSMCNGLIHCVWWRNKHWVPKKDLKYPNQTQDGQDWPGERHWSDRSCVGANRPSPALLGRLHEHGLRHHPLSTNIPGSWKSSHRAWIHPSCVHNDCRRRRGWGELPIEKCDRRVGLPGWSSNLRKKRATRTFWDPRARGPIQSTSSRAKAKVDRPQDVP